jgi:hypothetical protein
MTYYEVFAQAGEQFLGVRLLWPWQASELRARGYIVIVK